MRYLRDLDRDYLNGKKCLLRINLDVTNPKEASLRINIAIPTINFLLDKGASILILSHRGRPEGEDKNLSLKPLIEILENKIGQKIGWLENLRFDPKEQENDDDFAKELAAKGDFFVNDDFAVSHRANTSISAITKYLPSFAGLNLEKEIKTLSQVMDNPEEPLVVIIGGVKIGDKIGVIENLYSKADRFLMGSAYIDIDNSILKKEKVVLPEDWIVGDGKKLDIGQKTIENFGKIISKAKTIIWNGPMGKFEDSKYIEGSKKVAEAIASSNAFSIIGGGDTYQLLSILGMEDGFGFISTGGGAMLEFLAGKKLPALTALNENEKTYG